MVAIKLWAYDWQIVQDFFKSSKLPKMQAWTRAANKIFFMGQDWSGMIIILNK